jgi:hypothetical protein
MKRTRLSVCRRKARFPTREEALLAIRGGEVSLRPYRCDRCGQFHLTSRIKGKWMPKAARAQLIPSLSE